MTAERSAGRGKEAWAVTGLGAVASLGTHPGDLWARLVDGATGVGPIDLFDPAAPAPNQACEVRGFDAARYLGPRGLRGIDRSGRLALVAAGLALQQLPAPLDPLETGVVLGTGFGSVHSIAAFDRASLQEGPSYVNPADFPNTTINAAASQVGIRWGLKGLNCTVSSGFCAGLDAFGCATGYLEAGLCRAALVGGVEELCLESLLGFFHSGLLALPDGEPAPARPFDRRRRGAVLGEGACMSVVEPESRAVSAGRPVLARILAYGSAHSGGCGPDSRAMARSMALALERAGLLPRDVDLVVAGASGAPEGDREEALALLKVFGAGGGRARICAPKGALGECYGSAGALCVLVAVLALETGVVPPTAGFEETDLGLSRVSGSAVTGELNLALVHAFGCDGRSSALVLEASQTR
ncbi:MAG: hypothetical protein K6T75_02830 [Acetobacteraceae bacterium]|nr:hypothetical protein [Acetobacteraceae bacterium]